MPDKEDIKAARRSWASRLRSEGKSPAAEVHRRINESSRLESERSREELVWQREEEEAARKAAERRDFKPYALNLTERQPANYISGIGHGFDCRIKFKKGSSENYLRDQALRALRDEAGPWRNWGKPVGFEVCYSVGRSVQYDLDGDRVAGESRRLAGPKSGRVAGPESEGGKMSTTCPTCGRPKPPPLPAKRTLSDELVGMVRAETSAIGRLLDRGLYDDARERFAKLRATLAAATRGS